MTARAQIRNLRGEYVDAEMVDVDAPGVLCVAVPGFGHVLMSVLHEHAVLAQGPGLGEHPRDVVIVDGHYEIEVLPNEAHEDRIVVVITP